MQPYVLRHVPAPASEIFGKIKAIVDAMPDIDLGARGTSEEFVSCHMIARGLAKLFPELELQDGKFHGSWQHSWLM
jgi:hypothetical protein